MRYRHTRQAGFTLLEILIVAVVISILGAIATPSWLQFLVNREVEAARDEIHQGIRQAQTQAIAQRAPWRFSIRESDGQVEWAIHPQTRTFAEVSSWQTLATKIVLDEANTLALEQDNVYYVEFDFKGTVEGRSIFTVEDRGNIADKKCVLLTNLLGSTYEGQELSKPNRFGFECF